MPLFCWIGSVSYTHLRYVVGGYIGGRPESIEALEEMKHLAVLMRYELEQGRIDEFAKLLNRHWEVSKKLDAGSTNTCIDQIFESCEDLIDGKFISDVYKRQEQGVLKTVDGTRSLDEVFQEIVGVLGE